MDRFFILLLGHNFLVIYQMIRSYDPLGAQRLHAVMWHIVY